jgi:hypothetical protein
MNPDSLPMIETTATVPRLVPGSQVHALANLSMGETYCVSHEVDGEGGFAENVETIRRRMTNTINKSVQRAKQAHPDRSWSIESGVTITSRNNAYFTLIVFRIA